MKQIKYKIGSSIGVLFKLLEKIEERGKKYLPKFRKRFSMVIPIKGNVLFHFVQDIQVKGSAWDLRQLALLLEDETLGNFDDWYLALKNHDKKMLKKLIEEI